MQDACAAGIDARAWRRRPRRPPPDATIAGGPLQARAEPGRQRPSRSAASSLPRPRLLAAILRVESTATCLSTPSGFMRMAASGRFAASRFRVACQMHAHAADREWHRHEPGRRRSCVFPERRVGHMRRGVTPDAWRRQRQCSHETGPIAWKLQAGHRWRPSR